MCAELRTGSSPDCILSTCTARKDRCRIPLARWQQGHVESSLGFSMLCSVMFSNTQLYLPHLPSLHKTDLNP